MKRSVSLGILAVVVVVFGGVVWATQRDSAGTDGRVALAQCLTEKGAKEYGAYWCPNCKTQKDMFGRAFKHIDYVECAMPGNPRAQTPTCQSAGITGYPTWVFADGSQAVGVQSLEALAEQAGCTFAEQDDGA